MMEQRYLPQSYGLKMLNAALVTRTNQDKPTEEENQSYKRSRFDPFDIDPDDPFDVSKSKSGTEYHITDSGSVGRPRVLPHKENNQPHKWSRFDNVPDDPDPVDALNSKSGNDGNPQDPTDQDWTDCNDLDPDYIPDSSGSEGDSNEVPMQSIPQNTLSILDVEQSVSNTSTDITHNFEASSKKPKRPCDITPNLEASSKKPKRPCDITHNLEAPSKKPKRPCLYCGVFHAQLVRHLKRKHQDEEAVAAALTLPKVEQGRALADIRKLGIYECNVARRNENSSAPLIKERRQGTCSVLMCSGCKGFFDSKTIWKHKKRCFSDGQLSSVNVSSLSKDAKGLDLPEDFKTQVVDAFRKDPVGTLCRNDKVILIMGKKWWAKSERKDKHTIMAEMRLYANIIMEMRKCSQQDITGEDVLNRDYFEFLNKAIVTLTTKESGEASMKSGLKLRIGFLLKKAINILKGYYILNRIEDKEKEVDRFAAVLQLNWDYMFYSAQLRCELRRNDLRKPKAMPDEEDLKKLRNFVLQEMEKLLDPYKVWDKHDYVWMRNLVVSRLIMFNARRGGEPARLTVKEWEEAEQNLWVDPRHVKNIKDDLERVLVDKYKLAYQSGKGSRKLVPLLIPNDTADAMKRIVQERSNFVSDQNSFLFANLSDSKDHVIGWNCLKSVTSSLGSSLQSPHLLIADKFRHRMSTLYALLDVSESERDAFYRHMGHSAEMNKNVYQCPAALREVTKVGAFLKNVDEHTYFPEVLSSERNEIPCDIPCSEINTDALPHQDVIVAPPQDEVEGTESSQISCRTKSPRKSSKKGRKYTKWNAEDTWKVNQFFRSYITTQGVNVSLGSLPSKEMVLEFLSEYNMFDDLTEKEKIVLIKTKVFNERKKIRMTGFQTL